ncbi:hypothetical protein COOONC_01228 [Cooperia oncophora]
MVLKETMELFETALETVNPSLHLPLKNDYIATKFDLKPRETTKWEHPRVIQDDAWCRIWFKQDDEYDLPKAVTRVALISPMVMKAPESEVLLKMFSLYLQDALFCDVANAELAGLYCNIKEEDFGLLLEGYGSVDRLWNLWIDSRPLFKQCSPGEESRSE